MDFLLPSKEEFIETSTTIPRHLAKYAITGAQARYKVFRQGSLLTQVLLGNDYSIWVHYFFIREEATLLPVSKVDMLTLHYMMNGNINGHLHGHGPVLLEEGKYHFFYVPGKIKHEAMFMPGFYQCFHVNFHPAHIEAIAKQYPLFEPMLTKAEQQTRSGGRHEPCNINTNIRHQLHDILHNHLPAVERALFLEAAIRNLLRLYISDLTAREMSVSTSNERVQLLARIEAYVESHLDKKLTVDRIARKFNISRSWLQYICAEHFQMGVYQLVRKKRMEAAATLLLETQHPVGTIVMMVSDMTFAAFTAAFREYYGQPPVQYRRNKGRKP